MAARRPKSPPTPIARSPRHALLIAALWAIALAAYSNSFQAGLVFDSQRVVLADSRVQADTPENVRQIWSGDYYNGTGSSALYRPFTTLTYLWNYADFGDGPNAAGYHRVNFLLHAMNIALVYLLGLVVLRERWQAFALAALWSVHPVLTEAVTNVAGRADLLASLGVLAGILCYVRSTVSSGWRRAAWILALAAASAIAVFSKESGIVLPAAIVIFYLVFRPRISWRGRGVRYLVVLLPVFVFLWMRSRALAQVSSLLISFGDNPLLGAGFWTSRFTAIRVLAHYLLVLLWPARLSADYSYNQIPLSNWTSLGTIIAILLWAGVTVLAVLSYRRAKPVCFFILFFLVTIAPVANLVILVGSIMAERFLYLPSAGFAGCVVWAALAAYRRAPAHWPPARMVLPAALAIVCLLFAARTYARNLDWHDERSLWTSAVAVGPESYKTHQNLAQVMLAQPQPDYAAATREVERALAILDPLPDSRNMPAVYATAGRCYRTRGDPGRALTVLLRGRAIDRAWNEAFVQRNRLDGKTVGMVGTPSLYLDLGQVYLDLGQPDKALEALGYGRSIDPQPAFFEELSRAYTGTGQSEKAAISLLEGLAVDPGQSAFVTALTQLYQETAPQSCALDRTASGINLNVNCPMVHDQLCTASHNVSEMFTRMRDVESANAVAQNAFRNYGCPAALSR